ncbi:RIC1-domain-containing protein [Gautieria morchelliformis]|nr:RIC1-domain-containing protein [Gautieria morchelliformis]
MYFPTATARKLSAHPSLPHALPHPTIALSPSPRKSLFVALTKDSLSVWRVRPFVVLAYLSRTSTSLLEHGENKMASWSPDGNRIVIETVDSHLVLVVVEYSSASTPYRASRLSAAAQRQFLPGPGEGPPIQSVSLQFEGVVRIDGGILSVSPRSNHILFSTKSPPAVQRIPWPSNQEEDEDEDGPGVKRKKWLGHDTWVLNDLDFPWLRTPNVTVNSITYSRITGAETWVTSDGRAYFVHLSENAHPSLSDLTSIANTNGSEKSLEQVASSHVDEAKSSDSVTNHQILHWDGTCIHDVSQNREEEGNTAGTCTLPSDAVRSAINAKFSLVAIGTRRGTLEITNFPSHAGVPPRTESLLLPTSYNRTGPVHCMEWSSDGYVLAVGWEAGWAVWSVGGRCLAWAIGVDHEIDGSRFHDLFMHGVMDLFWIPGNCELVVLANPVPIEDNSQLFAIPFAKSAVTGQHTPDNTRYAFLQMDDRVLVYRGADQPDMSVINPESDVWQHIKIPLSYLADNWPIRYASISNDGRLVAVAGRRGLVHYSAASGRWKVFNDHVQEQAFAVKGGLIWFHHVLIAAVDASKSYQVRLYSRDLELTNQSVLHREVLKSPVVLLSLVDNSLLVYTADNTLSHYLVIPTSDSIKLHLCGSISFDGVVAVPSVVRGMSWMIPTVQKQLGDPVDDLVVATILLLVGGKLVLLRPRKSGTQEVKYDMQILADRIEFCWIHLRGIGTLENSLWGYDGQGIRLWLDALTIEAVAVDPQSDTYESVQESVNIPLNFYPLSVLMDKGIIIGVEHEAAARYSLPFVMFRIITSTHLFLHHVLRFHLGRSQVREAVAFASHYQNLVFFSHALEVLLHTVIESETDQTEPQPPTSDDLLPVTVEFLDHFDAALEVVVGCARKTEMARWRRLFDIVGNPKALFETCLSANLLTTAGSYLLVLHNLEQLDEGNDDAIRLLRRAAEVEDWALCRELLRFLRSIDTSGHALRNALSRVEILSV